MTILCGVVEHDQEGEKIMTRKSLLCLTVVLALLLCLFSGCGSSTSTTTTESTESTESTETQTEAAAAETTEASEVPAAEASSEEAAEAPAEEEVPEEEAAEAAAPEKVAVELPLTADPVTYTIWYNEPFTDYVEDPATDISLFKELAERTNIQFEFSLTNVDTASEKFMLLFAAEELPDVITDAMEYYTGSIDDAVDGDAFLLNYAPYLDDMPNYSAVLSQYPEAKQTITSADTGYMVAFPEIYEDVGDVSGYMIRQDYLDALGMDVPETYDELHDLLAASVAEYGATLELGSTGGDSLLGAGFGINTSLDDSDLDGWYVEDGVVKMGILEPEFKDYLEMVKQWYSEGLIYADFINTDRGDLSSLFDGSFLITVKPPEIIQVADAVIGTPMVAMSMPKQNADDEFVVCGAATSCLMDANAWSINADVEDPTLLLQLVDYLYSDDGYYLVNYGVEGTSYTMEDGEPVFTDLVINNADGLDYSHAAYLFASSNRTRLPFLSDYARCFATYTDAEWDAIDIYSYSCDHTKDYPLGAIMTTAQTQQYNTVAADICTFISENVLKFIYGQRDMSEWDEFIDTIYSMGIETAISAKQAAYDDYLAS
jgi:putative aldouronate transport system substrate-binding protein